MKYSPVDMRTVADMFRDEGFAASSLDAVFAD
jgi:hypothetical protein